jgi:hypothetical protein
LCLCGARFFVCAAGENIRKKAGGNLSPSAQRFAESAQGWSGKMDFFARFAQKFAGNAHGRKKQREGIVFKTKSFW